MAYIDSGYLDDALGAAKVAALCPTADELAAVIAQATAETQAALVAGGYAAAVPASVYASVSACPVEISLAAFGAWIRLAYGRNDLLVPESFATYLDMTTRIRMGEIEISTVAHSSSRGVGGVSFSSTDATTGTPSVFRRGSMTGF